MILDKGRKFGEPVGIGDMISLHSTGLTYCTVNEFIDYTQELDKDFLKDFETKAKASIKKQERESKRKRK